MFNYWFNSDKTEFREDAGIDKPYCRHAHPLSLNDMKIDTTTS